VSMGVAFCLLAKVGCPNLCLEERRKGFRGIHLREHPVLIVIGGYGGNRDSVSGEGGNHQFLP
jgi:hypothetical protein